ncbi:hypothetical protein M413DRAFT_164568 [Hebeloma cylindrosporum]|uniref:Uncharacterized protein n=1 Tax=Hebeloma cylindrosporum TaxID=76867 RepID=A0A0C2YHT6_HEBCY|nr:hypothetical protein M413DRAFT_164568 [Hebeloma cylindrosporum h7]
MPDPSGDFLTPRHIPSPLPQQHHQQQQRHQPQQQQQQQTPILPVRGLQYDTSGAPTVPNSPVVLDGPLPPNFIPQTLTNSRGVSTPFSRSSGLPGMSGGMSTPVIPGNPPPVFPSSAPPPAQTQVYGNPLAKNRDREEQPHGSPYRPQQQLPSASPAWNNKPFGGSGAASPAWGNKPFGTPGAGGVGGGAPPSPAWGASSPAAWGTNNTFGAPGISGSGLGNVSSPQGWGSANQPFIPPGVNNSAGGMTPASAPRNLPPGFAGSGTGSLAGRSGVSIYGPPLSGGGGGGGTPLPVPAPPLPGGFGAPSSPMNMPIPTVPTYGDDEDDGADRFDPTTEENTRLNAAVGNSSLVNMPGGSGAQTKKKKKKR